jgi:hypothetical protein
MIALPPRLFRIYLSSICDDDGCFQYEAICWHHLRTYEPVLVYRHTATPVSFWWLVIGSNFQISLASDSSRRHGPTAINIYSLVDRYSAGGANVKNSTAKGETRSRLGSGSAKRRV